MKKYILAINLLAFILMLSSCDDIVDADNNILKTKITYNTIKADQEYNVIMPLKVGNVWIYKTTIYTNGFIGTMTSYDTITVKEETIINGEKWFVVGITGKSATIPYYITNTDVGLYYKSSTNLNSSNLIAEYPLKHSSYYHGDQYYSAIYDDIHVAIDDSLDYWTNAEIVNNYPMVYGDYTAYKYNTWAKFRHTNTKLDTIAIEYYQPNIGIVHREEYEVNQDKSVYWTSISDLVYTNIEIGKPIKQSVFEINFGTLVLGESSIKTINSLLENEMDLNLIIASIEIDNDPSFSVINPPTMPFVVAPGEALGIKVKFIPTTTGIFQSDLQFFCTDYGLLTVKLFGRCDN
ncbi:MAG: hypothetical protein WCR42_04925 [bacterium]